MQKTFSISSIKTKNGKDWLVNQSFFLFGITTNTE